MASRFTELVIDAHDVRAQARWWAEVLDYTLTDEEEDAVEISAPDGRSPRLVFARVPEDKTVKNRLHIDLNATDRDQEAEVQRLVAMGAQHIDIGQRPDQSWVVLADPEGNEFCVLRSRVEP
jgi:predicted enzyme related to lactoylglutathione lyase